MTGRLGSNLVWEITDDFEFDLNYSINFPFSDFKAGARSLDEPSPFFADIIFWLLLRAGHATTAHGAKAEA